MKLLQDLRDKDWKAAGLLVAEGRLVAGKVLDAGLEVVEALCVPEAEPWCRSRLRDSAVLTVLPEPELGRVAGFPFHRGILLAARRPPLPVSNLPPRASRLILWQVTDPDNLGALVRTARALGVEAVALGPGCADPFSRKSLRASMGHTLEVPLESLDLEGLRTLAGSSALAAAALVPGARSLRGFSLPNPWTLVLGHEGYGLPEDVLALCPHKVMIPMPPGVDSLNVGAAGALFLWELTGKSPV